MVTLLLGFFWRPEDVRVVKEDIEKGAMQSRVLCNVMEINYFLKCILGTYMALCYPAGLLKKVVIIKFNINRASFLNRS